MFNGSKKYPKGEFDSVIESCGGYSNAWTSKDQTTFFEVFSHKNFPQILDLEADRFNNLNITPDVLEAERNVVMEERRLRIDNSMSGKMWELLYKNAYGDHPYHSPVLGWMEEIESITLDECNYFYKTYYSVNNAIITITGNFNLESTLSRIVHTYGKTKSEDVPKFPDFSDKLEIQNKKIEFCKPAELEMVLIGYQGCSGNSENAPIIDLLVYILVVGETSRLHRELVYEKESILEVFGDFHTGFNDELITFGYRIKPEHSYGNVLKSFDEQIEKICSNGITDTELEKSKNGIITSIVENLSTITDKAGKVLQYESLFEDYTKLFESIQKYSEITREDILKTAQKYLTGRNRTIIHLIPENQNNR